MRHHIQKNRRYLLLAVLALPLLCPLSLSAQSGTHNYISEKAYTQPNEASFNQTISYYDGLGRPEETVMKGAWISAGSVSGDVVGLRTYDASGRPSRTYLPVGINGNGSYAGETTVTTAGTNLYSDAAPFSEVHYDGSPLDRVRSEWGAGSAWRTAGKAREYGYCVNDSNQPKYHLIKLVTTYSGNAEAVVHKSGSYASGDLQISETTDEDGRSLLTFTDAFGQTVLERRLLGETDYADTYYCYDASGRLVSAFPPELSAWLTGVYGMTFTLSSVPQLRQHGYFYRYDNKGQLIAKKLPGAEWIYYVYDKGGRLIYSQDGNQRLRGEWSFALSDRQGRPCLTGTKEKDLSPFTDPLGDVQVFVQRNDPSTDMRDYGYLPVNFDLSDADILTVSWYDDYAFLGNMDGIPSAASSSSPTRFYEWAPNNGYGDRYDYGGAGRMTGRMEKVLGETDGNQYLWSVLYYDDHGRVVQESHSTHRGGWQRTNTGYDFPGHPLMARIHHVDPTVGNMTEYYTYSYDAWGRPLTVTHRLDNLPAVTLHNYSYDAIGRVTHDQRNGDADLATQYSYNVRSWLTDIKVGGDSSHGTLGETFTEKLYYQNQRPVNQQSTVQWGGNVSAMDWMAGSDGVSRRYDFAYDGLSRLTGAGYADDGAGQSDYSRGYGYDRNGNVTLLATATDTTQVSYSGNHLTSGSNYAYDANGNLTKDLGRGIVQISYNLLNLPSSVAPGLGGGPHGVIYGADSRDYLYTASGVKLQSKAMLPLNLPGMPDVRERTDYVGNLIYDRTSLQKVLFDGGYVDMSGDSPEYRFFVTDHLGNNRLVADAAGTILQTNHYDPYGESLPDGSAVDSGNPYKWGGKEYDDKALAYDFGARHYTSSIPRWTTMDPLCEKYYSISPYAYCAGNPMRYTDLTGKIIDEDNLKEWERLKRRIENRRDRIQRRINKCNDKAKTKGWSTDKLEKIIGNKAERLASLNSSIKTMGTLEGSTQVYSLSHTAENENGGVSLNTATNVVDIKFGSTASFVHEMTHAGQFESGDIAFTDTGKTFFQDVYDEVSAYKAQFGYSPSSVSGLKSISVANSFDAITPLWVQGIIDPTGSQPYAEGGAANTGVISVNINSSKDDLIQAYPWLQGTISALEANVSLKAVLSIYYKQ